MIIAITGGIGAGKSVVSDILRAIGYPVYDCDSRARAIMDSDPAILRALADEISPEVIGRDGAIDRPKLASIVFNDPDKLQRLNSIVHAAVRADLQQWMGSVGTLAFVETAILYQSGLDRMVDEVWEVAAPEALRIERVCRRNSLTPEQVQARISSQRFQPECPHPRVCHILNDGVHSLLLQIHSYLKMRVS